MTQARKSLLLSLITVAAFGLAACQRNDGQAPADASAMNADTTGTTPGVTPTPDPSSTEKLKDTLASDASAAADTVKEKSAEAGAKLDDAGLTTKVKAALAKDAGLATLKINVTSNAGVVTLTGNVDSDAKLQEVNTTVSALEGVKSLNNQLVVKSK